MAIKKLQHGFTNPDQSRMLLKLGVPADSADMYYKQCSEAVVCVGEVGDVPKVKTFYIHEPNLRHINPEGTWTLKDGERIDLSGKVDELRKTDIPCWTVGCLMEIFDTCYTEADADAKWENYNALHKGQTYVDYIMYVFDHNYMCGKLDFSKLEE